MTVSIVSGCERHTTSSAGTISVNLSVSDGAQPAFPTPTAGDKIVVLYRSFNSRVVSSISGLGGTYSSRYNNGNGSVWMGESVNATGTLSIVQNSTGAAIVSIYLVRGLPSSPTASGQTLASTTLTSEQGPTAVNAGNDQIAFHMVRDAGSATGLTFPHAEYPSGWTLGTIVTSGVNWGRSGYRIPTGETQSGHRLTSSGKTNTGHWVVVFGTYSAPSSDVTVAAPVLSVVADVLNPTVNAAAPPATVTAPALALAAALLMPTVSAVTPQTITPPALGLAIASHAPSVAEATGATVAAPVLDLTVAVPAPVVVEASPGVTVTAPTLAVDVAIPAPTVLLAAGVVTVAAPVLNLTMSLPAPAVETPDQTSAPWDADASGQAIVGIVAPVGIYHVAYPAAAIPAAVEPVMLTRVSHQIPADQITVDVNGRPVPIDEADYTIVREDIGYLKVWFGGVDVTFHGGVPTKITSYSAALPFGERNAQIDFPQLMLLDTPPAVLDGDKPVDIAVVKLDTSRINLWSGQVISRSGGNAERDVRSNRQAEGPLMAADHQLHQVPLTMPTTDRGVVIADELNGTGSRTFGTIAPALTGQYTRERGSSNDRRLDHAQNQLAQLWTPAQDQWTVARTDTPRAYKMALKSTIGSTWTLTYGAPGVQVDLTRDETQRYNVIWGHGTGPADRNGVSKAWQNMFFPGLLGYDPPDYPFSDTSNELELGTTDADTDSGDGVSVWQARMVELGITVAVDGVINAADQSAARTLQRLRGILVDGQIGPQTWNATWDVGATGAALERIRLPLAYDPRVWPTLHAANGKVIGPNPDFDPTIVRYESEDIEFPPGTTKAEGIVSAQDMLARNLDPGWTGRIVLQSCPWEGWRGLIREGDRVNLLGYEGETVALSVAVIEGSADDKFTVTLSVDEKARDAMTLASIRARDRESAADLAHKPGTRDRISQIDRNQSNPFEWESPAGKLPKLAINGDAGLWTVWPVFVSEMGTLAYIDLQTSGPACEFSAWLFGTDITANQCAQHVGNPLTSDTGETNRELLEDRFWLVNAWGNESEPAGHFPNKPDGATTGRLFDNSPLTFQSKKDGWLWVAIYASTSCSITGRIYPGAIQ